MLPRKVLFLGPQKCRFPCFPGVSFINQSMKKNANYSLAVTLFFICQPLELLIEVFSRRVHYPR